MTRVVNKNVRLIADGGLLVGLFCYKHFKKIKPETV